MEREIHRMRLRAGALERTQEKLIKDMELAIDKREMISIKVKAKSSGAAAAAAAAPVTQIGVKKQIAALKNSLRAATVDAQGYDEALQLKRGELEEIEAAVEAETKTLSSFEAEAAALQHSINGTLYEKQRNLEKLASIQVRRSPHSRACFHVPSRLVCVMCMRWRAVVLQRTLNRYEALSRGRRAPLSPDEADSVHDAERAAIEDQQRIRAVIDGLVEAHPGMSEVLHRVSQLLDV